MPDAFQLLSLSASVTQNAFDRIDRQMSQSMELRQRAGEFEVGMAAKAVAFAEEQRINNARMQEMASANEIRAREASLREKMMPLELETARLRLKRTEHLMTKQKEAEDIAAFNDITAIEDYSSGVNVMRTQSSDHLKALLDVKSRHRASVAQGGDFNRDQYVKELSEVNDKFKDIVADPKAEYSEETSYLLGVFSPKIQSIYDKKSLAGDKNVRAMQSAYIRMPADQALKFMSENGHLLGGELANLNTSQIAYQASKLRMEAAAKEANDAMAKRSEVSHTDEPDVWKNYNDLVQHHTKERDSAFKDMIDIDHRVSTGDYRPASVEKIAPIKEGPNPDDYKEPDKRTLSGLTAETKDTIAISMRDKAKAIHDILDGAKKGMGEQLLGGDLSLGWFQDPDEWNKGKPDDNTLIKMSAKINQKIDSLNNIGDVMNEDRTNKILERIKLSDGIPIDKVLAEDIYNATKHGSANPVLFEDRDFEVDPYKPGGSSKPYLRIGGSKKKFGNNSIRSYDDVMSIVSKLPRSKQKYAMEEISAAILTASLSHAVSVK